MTTKLPTVCALVLLSVFVGPYGHWRSVSHAFERPSADLGTLYSGPDGFVRDTNGDGVPDVVVARVVAPAAPPAQDIESAANIAARLGYETTALSLPLIVHDNDVDQLTSIERPIFVGRSNAFVKRLESSGVIDLKTLKPRQGLLVPSPMGKADAVVVGGADDEGTLAAAMELAARLPKLWTMTGATVAGLEDQTRTYLTSKGIAVTGAVVPGLIVDADRLGLAVVHVKAEVSGGASRAIAALEDVDLVAALAAGPLSGLGLAKALGRRVAAVSAACLSFAKIRSR